MPVYIPEEILDKIIDYATAPLRYFSYAGELEMEVHVGGDFSKQAASFVSHAFHQIVLPYKFRSLTFQLSNIKSIGDDFISRVGLVPIPKFCEAINAGDTHALSLAPLVQELNLLYWSNTDRSRLQFIPETFEKVINGVLFFRNLTKLRMESCVTSPAIMEQLGKLVQLQSLHTRGCRVDGFGRFGALSNLQCLHTLECKHDWLFASYLACIPMKNLRILKTDELEVIEVLLATDPPVQLKELWLSTRDYWCRKVEGPSLLWNYLARVTSLTHLSLPDLKCHLPVCPPSLIFPFQELQHLCIHVALAPRFADQPMKKLTIYTESGLGQAMVEVRQHWQGIVFPHVEYLKMDRRALDRQYDELDKIPIEFWREFLLNVIEVQ